jgi:PAS domain S-box-containing protein
MVSKSKRALQSDAGFKILFEKIPGLYLVLLPNLVIYAVSDDYASATLTRREDIVGKYLFEVFPDNPDDAAADGVSNLRTSLELVLKNKTAHTMAVQKYDVRRADGSFEEKYWSPHNKPVLNSNGEIVFIIHRVEDVTQFIQLQKLAEKVKPTDDSGAGLRSMEMEIVRRSQEIQKLNESLAQDVTDKAAALKDVNKVILDYKFALDTSCIVAVTDQKGIILHVNDNFCQISKYSREELLGQDHRIINSGYHPKEFIRDLWVTIAKGKIWRGELKNRAKDGSTYWVDTTIVPFLNERGKPYQYIAIRADITSRKIAEEENLRLQADLEMRVQQRTHDLEAFSYSVSHDLRAPLRTINGYAAMLEEDYSQILDDEGKRLLNIIRDGARKMGKLIDDLLAFSKLGRKEVSKSNVDMQSMVKNICDDLGRAPDFRARIDIGELEPVLADFTLMNHVWTNLLSNAIKYSANKEKPLVKIRSNRNNGMITYSITDNGAGFDMKYADKLFGVFQRLHSSDDFEGTGVGLAIVHRIISRHDGKIWAEGSPGEGATFYFSLPSD